MRTYGQYFFPFFLMLIIPGFSIAQQDTVIRFVRPQSCFQPLEEVELTVSKPGSLSVLDGAGNVYFQASGKDRIRFAAGGALGSQTVLLRDKKGKLLDWATFCVNGETYLHDEGSRYETLLQTLYHSMIGEWGREADVIRFQGRFYHFFVRWLRDHVHTLKGMKYFYPELKSGIDIYAETQREDGMIWDNIYPRNHEKNWWDKRFRYGDFIREAENGALEFKRIPIENDVEYLFIEGLYYTWKATGDDEWMHSHLDQALKAVQYATSDPYRWSEKYQLLKRGFTIDTWDFQSNEDAALVGGDIMVVELNKTRFGIMFGDNTGMAMSCRYLAEMLSHSDRKVEAEKITALGRQIQERIDALAWNGEFYTHHIPEDPNLKRSLGVDLSSQVSLSNAYSINRALTREQRLQIIKTYQRIRQEMPASSPGEWYTIYPPFPNGFGLNDSSEPWEYMNGGVTSIVAGELAHGAFENGFETYGVDILDRLAALAGKNNNFLHCTYRGALPEAPVRHFTFLPLQPIANVDYPGQTATSQGNWIGSGHRDGVVEWSGVPFQIVDPTTETNPCLRLGTAPGAKPRQTLAINQKTASIYLLHTTTPGNYNCHFKIHYADGSTHTDYLTNEKVGNWWIEHTPRDKDRICAKAWRSDNDQYITFYVYGWNNPFPDKPIDHLEFVGAEDGGQWNILGLTLCDAPVFFMPDEVSHGIPDNWGAAAVVYALVEGLAGVKDLSQSFENSLIAPRWTAAGVNSVDLMIKYPASKGYVSYQYHYDPGKNKITIKATSNGATQSIQCLLPANKKVEKVQRGGQPVAFQTDEVEHSNYVVFSDEGVGVKFYEIYLSEQ